MSLHDKLKDLSNKLNDSILAKSQSKIDLSSGKKIYHYTNIAGLKGIIESSSLWLSDATFLNDSEELLDGKNIAEQRLEDKLRFCKDEDFKSVLELTKQGLEDEKQYANIFIASFSEANESLEQWRAYGDNGKGVCISFNLNNKMVFSKQIFKVIYDNGQKRDILDEIINSYADAFDNQSDKYHFDTKKLFSQFLLEDLRYKFILFKNEAFKTEKEMRLIHKLPKYFKLHKQLRFRLSNNIIVPYIITSDLIKNREFKPSINSITVGLISHQQATIKSIENLIKYSDYQNDNIKVVSSKIPYRS